MGHPSARSLPRTYVPSASSGQALGYCLPPSPLRGCGRDRSEGSQNPHRHASVPRIGMLRLRSRFVTRAGKPGSGEGQNTNGLRVVESHFSQRTREMGHPAAVESTQDLRPFGELWAGSGLLSAAPPGLVPFSSGIPTACAVGCILSPLRGCGRDRSEGSQNPQPSRLRAADRDASTALPVCHSRRETGERRGSKYQWLRVVESHFSQRTREMGQPAAVVVPAEKQVPRLRVSVLRTITLRSG